METAGAGAFGLVIGWITYRTLRRSTAQSQISDLASVVGAVGGAAVAKLFETKFLFGWYSVGLAVGFFGYLLVGFKLEGKDRTVKWMFDDEGAET